ncbi:MAG: ACT domain-containing protein [Firmicutes bacterium]|nr:ACT domain-containing protein [Bacillota bacterium]
MIKALVTVTGKDRTGIIAGVATRLAQCDVNILEISQTVLSGYFTMMMVVDLSGSSLSFGQVGEELKQAGAELGMNVTIQRMDIFDAMHRI